MKNAIIFIGLIILSTSCKKEYNCNCTSTLYGQSTEISTSLGKNTHKEAVNKCNDQQTSLEMARPGAVVICNLN